MTSCRRSLRSPLLVPALALALALAVAGCGGGDEGGSGSGSRDDADAYVEAMASSMAGSEDSPMDEEQATCFSRGLVDVVGLERIRSTGTPKEWADQSKDLEYQALDLTEDEGNSIYDNFAECGVDMRDAMLSEFADDDSMDDKTRACVTDAVTDENLREFFVTVMVSGDTDSLQDSDSGLMRDLLPCVMGGLGGDETQE